VNDRDRGAASVWSLALVQLLLLVALVCAGVASQVLTRQNATTVADLASLAAAQAVDDPCGQAGRVAAANEMSLMGCHADGADVVVEVAASPSPLVRRLFALLGRDAVQVTVAARAGPPSP
jgi:secretion/DNA translocation related TadE-like protein